ncbi:hypothetical protein OZ664_03345 [Elizabethkingia sp. HX WHF]|uniref:hypothetical protein n=1 Tax=Elizabethkingia TaxID=308865 RepID=UPI000999B405|nr:MULTISPECIES: hypothetical protein [Elizabethkingia]ATL42394.1 hypothetical protein CQS02_03280 [Elizabethkingia miricola]MCL1638868.1 fimbrillin family protein [Elizabethkingia bruuniana]MDX8563022.1 hypothetical protein [Elizabethkingia sp. HX WHF]OPC22478.1 hypothetical protein BAY00_18230 [Elizabethkingia bruuniana]
MKTSPQYFKSTATSLFVGSILFLQSCSNTESIADETVAGGKTQLIVNVAGIIENTTPETQASLKTAKSNATEIKTMNFGNLQATFSVEQAPMNQFQSTNTMAARSVPALAAVTTQPDAPMEKDNTYRIFLYDKSNGNLISSTPLVSGTPQSLEVDKGKTYNYYAYSYNNKEALADVTSVPSAIDKDLLYTSGEVTIPKVKPQGELETVSLPLTFRHMMSRITVAVNARALFARITSLNAKFGSASTTFPQGTLDLKTGNITPGQAANFTGDIPLQNSKTYEDRVKETAFYTTASGALPLQVVVTNLNVKYDDTTTEAFTATINPTFNDLALAQGRNTIAGINLIKGSTVDPGGDIWASGNLYYDFAEKDPLYKYKIRPDDKIRLNAASYIDTDYWVIGASIPAGGAGNIPVFWNNPASLNLPYDQCAQVYPKGTWRLPYSSNFGALNRAASNQIGNIARNPYLEYTTGSQTIRFNMDGIVTSSSGNPGTFSNSFDVNGNANTSANASKYLTNTPYAEFMPTIEYARISQLGILNAPDPLFTGYTSKEYGKNYISGNDTERFQIRCIRVKK